jgi:hypothetical protein
VGPANAFAQCNAVVGYESLLDSHIEPISIDVGLREPTLTTSRQGSSNTMMLNPINGQLLVDAFVVSCLSYQETMAEKLRAALTRRDVAIGFPRPRGGSCRPCDVDLWAGAGNSVDGGGRGSACEKYRTPDAR